MAVHYSMFKYQAVHHSLQRSRGGFQSSLRCMLRNSKIKLILWTIWETGCRLGHLMYRSDPLSWLGNGIKQDLGIPRYKYEHFPTVASCWLPWHLVFWGVFSWQGSLSHQTSTKNWVKPSISLLERLVRQKVAFALVVVFSPRTSSCQFLFDVLFTRLWLIILT